MKGFSLKEFIIIALVSGIIGDLVALPFTFQAFTSLAVIIGFGTYLGAYFMGERNLHDIFKSFIRDGQFIENSFRR